MTKDEEEDQDAKKDGKKKVFLPLPSLVLTVRATAIDFASNLPRAHAKRTIPLEHV